LVDDRDRVSELSGEDSRTLAVVGTFRIVPEQDLDIDAGTLHHLRDEGLVETVGLGTQSDSSDSDDVGDRLRRRPQRRINVRKQSSGRLRPRCVVSAHGRVP
jgi:hypothetical protein